MYAVVRAGILPAKEFKMLHFNFTIKEFNKRLKQKDFSLSCSIGLIFAFCIKLKLNLILA